MPSPVTDNVPLPSDHAPMSRAVESTIATLFAPVFVSDTAPPKMFAASERLIPPAPALTLAAPATFNAPD